MNYVDDVFSFSGEFFDLSLTPGLMKSMSDNKIGLAKRLYRGGLIYEEDVNSSRHDPDNSLDKLNAAITQI